MIKLLIALTLVISGCATTQKPTPFELGAETFPPMGYGKCVEEGICKNN